MYAPIEQGKDNDIYKYHVIIRALSCTFNVINLKVTFGTLFTFEPRSQNTNIVIIIINYEGTTKIKKSMLMTNTSIKKTKNSIISDYFLLSLKLFAFIHWKYGHRHRKWLPTSKIQIFIIVLGFKVLSVHLMRQTSMITSYTVYAKNAVFL